MFGLVWEVNVLNIRLYFYEYILFRKFFVFFVKMFQRGKKVLEDGGKIYILERSDIGKFQEELLNKV